MQVKNRNPLKIKKIRIGMLSLGCPKTLVDSETILGKVVGEKCALVPSVTDCDVALLNTCAFIRDAQQESVDRILELIELKKEKRIRALIVMGCLVQRFPKELQKELKEVDAFIGSGEYAKIPEIVKRVTNGQHIVSIGLPGYLATSSEARVALTPPHYRYLKISEGCDHVCTFCTIPSFRGKHRSRTMTDVVDEAKRLVDEGAKEIILTGQDTSYFGRDLEGKFLLPKLLAKLDKIRGLEWIRILYAYPSCITRELMQVMRDLEHVCHYLDMPLQHASERMLLAMKRGITKPRTVQLIEQFRKFVPDLAIRTTFIVGFPGETEEDFEELLAFMKVMKFERLGIFTYSQEQGSEAAKMPGQISDVIKRERLNRAMALQQDISRQNNQKWIGKSLRVLFEEPDEKESGQWIGRSYMDAPEVDGNVFVRYSGYGYSGDTHLNSELRCVSPELKTELSPGSFHTVKIKSTKEYDLLGEL